MNGFIETEAADRKLRERAMEEEMSVEEMYEKAVIAPETNEAEEEDVFAEDGKADAAQVEDSFRLYLREIGRFPLLTAEEELDLARKTAAGDGKARKKLVESNLRLVVSIARCYRKTGVDIMDLIEEGTFGLMKGIDRFDPERGFKLSTYVSWWIRQSISRYLADHGRSVRLPVHMIEEIGRMEKARKRFCVESGHQPDLNELAEAASMTKEKIAELLDFEREAVSLDTPIGEDGDASLGDLIASSYWDPEQRAEERMMKEKMAELLEKLSDREREVICLRFGLADGELHTLENVGEIFHITRERVRQIEAKAIRKLQMPAYRAFGRKAV